MGKNERDDNSTPERGQGHASPRKPHRFSKPGWKNALKVTFASIGNHNLNIVAAGVAFYLMLGLFPALAALISIYGLVSDPQQVQEHFAQIEDAIPDEAGQLLEEQMARIAEDQSGAGWGAFLGIAFALWAGSRAAMALMEGLNITYEVKERRGFVKKYATRLGLTLAAVITGLLAIAVIVFLPPIINALPVGEGVQWLLSFVRWPLLLLVGIVALAVLYRFGPSRKQPKFRWLSWGSGTAAIFWVVASALFSWYVANFGDYNETYGALGAVIILLMWLYISSFVILLGAELDAAFETQTEKEVLPDEKSHGGKGHKHGDDDDERHHGHKAA